MAMAQQPRSMTVATISTASAPGYAAIFIIIMLSSLEPAETGADYYEDEVGAEDDAVDLQCALYSRSVVYVECHGEEGQVADEPQYPRAASLPEAPLPGEYAAVVEEALDTDCESREHDAVENAVVDAEDLCLLILGQHQADANAHHEEHE